jgi:hypothetical protein
MNNSLSRLLDGMVATLRNEIIPHTQGEYPRGQAFGVIFMLESLRRRVDWSPAFIGEQLDAQCELVQRLREAGVSDDMLPAVPKPDAPDMAALQAARDLADRRVCALIDWIEDHRMQWPATHTAPIEQALRDYMGRQLRWELSASAKPMFAEISAGAE